MEEKCRLCYGNGISWHWRKVSCNDEGVARDLLELPQYKCKACQGSGFVNIEKEPLLDALLDQPVVDWKRLGEIYGWDNRTPVAPNFNAFIKF